MGCQGDSSGNELAESVIVLFNTKVIRYRVPGVVRRTWCSARFKDSGSAPLPPPGADRIRPPVGYEDAQYHLLENQCLASALT